MPPRSYYLSPRATDYIAFAEAFFPDELQAAQEFVRQTDLPYINGAEHIAAYVGVSGSLLRQIFHRPKFHYTQFEIPKNDGTKRKIETPKTYLKVIQWWILDNILSKGLVHEINHGFTPDHSYVSNARAHVDCSHILNLDIKKFFPSIGFEQIRNVYKKMGYSKAGADALAWLTSLDDCAPTGAPTSPMIGNLVLYDFDVELTAECKKMGFNYTRYADDITVSSATFIDDAFRVSVEALIMKYGFQTNTKKTKFMGRGDRMEVTGLTINNGINLSPKWRNSARGLLHRAILNPTEYKDRKTHISGIYGTLLAIDPEKTKKLTRAAEQALAKINLLGTQH